MLTPAVDRPKMNTHAISCMQASQRHSSQQEDRMGIPVNQFGIPQYPHDDARRLFVLACAIDLLERPTPSALDDLTGIDRSIIDDAVRKLCEQYGMTIHKFGDAYRIESWGEILNRDGVQKVMRPAA